MLKKVLFITAICSVFAISAQAAVDCGANTCVGTWEELKAVAAEGKTVYLTSDITIPDGESFEFPENMVVDGQEKYNFSTGNNISLINGNFVNSYGGYYGGTIFDNMGTINTINGTFENNSAKYGGGAIANALGTINTISGTFKNNSAKLAGAIYNGKTIDSINGTFENNSAAERGGAIINDGTITSIEGVFASNTATLGGGAIYNSETIGSISGTFTNNSAHHSGGAIYNGGDNLKIINSTFNNNYVLIDSSDPFSTSMGGGAIYSADNLTVEANGGVTEFTGNKQYFYNSAEDDPNDLESLESESNAIFMVGDFVGTVINTTIDGVDTSMINPDYQSKPLQLLASNGGKVIFNDQIDGFNMDIYDYFSLLGFQLNDNKTIALENGTPYFSIEKTDDGLIKMHQIMTTDLDASNIEQSLDALAGKTWSWANAERTQVTIGSDTYNLKPYEDGKYMLVSEDVAGQLLDNGVKVGYNINIDGDASGTVEFNEQIENALEVGLKNTNVVFGEKSQINNYTFRAESGVVNNAVVNDGGKLVVEADATANDTVVNSGGELSAEAQARLNNLLAKGGAVLDIESGAVLKGDIVIDKDAVMGGTYDYKNFFKQDDEKGSLTLTGGVNSVVEEVLQNPTANKNLVLADGSYNVSSVDGKGTKVNGWNQITITQTDDTKDAVLKLEDDLVMPDKDKFVYVDNGGTLDLSGNSPTNYTITGSLVNDGMVTFWHAGDDADDITTIEGAYKALAGATMEIDINPTTNTADKMVVEGDVAGTTSVIGKATADLMPSQKILFVEAPNDDLSTGAYFNVLRVEGSSYNWNTIYEDNKWYIGTDDVIPDGSLGGYGDGEIDEGDGDGDGDGDNPSVKPKPSVVAEAVAYAALGSAALEQNRDLLDKVAQHSASVKALNPYYNRNVWVAPVYRTAEVSSPVKYDADITGIEAGFEIQKDLYNKMGMFLSYRQGNYDLNGSGKEIYSKIGSEIDIDSYVAGLYYRYDSEKLFMVAGVYGGLQSADIQSDDGIKTDTDGTEFGAGIEVGMKFKPREDISVEPSVALRYARVDYDDIHDDLKKNVKLGDFSRTEAEVGVKLKKDWKLDEGKANAYVKPAIVQTFGDGSAQFADLGDVSSLDDETLGRLEIGGGFDINEQWNLSASAAYTFGSDYKDTSVNLDLKYNF